MPDIGISISGLDDCISRMKSLPVRIVKGSFGKAFASAAVPIVESLQAQTPVQTGLLRSSITADIGISSEGKGGNLAIGYGRQGHIARLVETGHRAIGHKPNKTDKGKMVPAHPFMRAALATSETAAIDAFKATLLSSLNDGEV